MKKRIMGKKIFLILLGVAILGAGFAGGVYAVDHQPVQGEKLVGVGNVGTLSLPTQKLIGNSSFTFTNTDCVNEITITKVSIIKQPFGLDPKVIYEGPFIQVGGDPYRVVITTMKPHAIWEISLASYMYTGANPNDLTDPENWLPDVAAINGYFERYTVEIEWEAGKGTCPLTGWQHTPLTVTDLCDNVRGTFDSGGLMVNLEQK